jgi:multisubunit Na+/H+ antiporter MnhB subunit
MKRSTHVVLAAAARLYAPLIVLFAFALMAMRAPGGGVGFLGGLAFGLAFLLHALVFGAAAARAAFPPFAARLLLAAGVGAAMLGAGAPGLPYAPQLIEGGLFTATAAAAALIASVLFGRLPTLSDTEW